MTTPVPNANSVLDRASAGLATLRDTLPLIIKNPRAYPRESMIMAVAAMLVLVLLMLVVFVIIGIVQDLMRHRQLGVRTRSGETFRRFGLLLGIVSLIAIMVTGATYVPQLDPQCARCHGVSSAVASWSQGVHSGVSCPSCHAKSGLTGAADWALARVACSLGHPDTGAGVNLAGCAGCHAKDIQGVREFAGIRVRHSDVIAAGMLCTDCHVNEGHGRADARATASASGSNPAQAVMARCVVCHDGTRARSGCSVCHTHKPNDDPGAPGTVQAIIAAQTTCIGCHTTKVAASCVNCHGLQLPHPMATFYGQHARLSGTTPSLCAKCHVTARFAQPCGCHFGKEGDNNPHGTFSDWYPKHGPAAVTAWPGNCKCHQDNFCLMCHSTLPATKAGNR